jgi:hypothetical protein
VKKSKQLTANSDQENGTTIGMPDGDGIGGRRGRIEGDHTGSPAQG